MNFNGSGSKMASLLLSTMLGLVACRTSSSAAKMSPMANLPVPEASPGLGSLLQWAAEDYVDDDMAIESGGE